MNTDLLTVILPVPVPIYTAEPYPPAWFALILARLFVNVELTTFTITLPDMNIAAPLPFCATFPSKVQFITSTLPV